MLRTMGLTILGLSIAALAVGQVVGDGSEPAGKRAVVVPIEGEINGITAWAVKGSRLLSLI